MALRRNLILILAASVLFSGLLARYLDRVPQRHYCDFRVYYKAGQDILRGKNIYFRETEAITPFKYSPFFAFVFSPLSLLPIKGAASVFFTLNFVLTILLFILAFKLFNHAPPFPLDDKKRLWVYGIVVACVLRYIFLVWDEGQVNILMCVLVLAGLNFAFKGRQIGAGAFFAAAILIKYTPVIFLPYLFLQKKYRAVMWTVIFAVIFLALPALMVGIQKEIFYLSNWIPSIIGTSLDQFSYIDAKNQSIFSMVIRFFSPTFFNVQIFSLNFHQALWLGYAAALLLYMVVFMPGRSVMDRWKIDLALLFICMALFNPNAWFFNFITLGVPYMLLLCYVFTTGKRDWLVIGSLIVSFALITVMAKDIAGKSMEDLGGMYSFTAWGALLLFAALIKLKFFTKPTTAV